MGNQYERNLRELQAFLDNPYVAFVPVSLVTADRYSRVAASLRAKGRPIPTNDIWIAAQAMETGAELVSFDHTSSASMGSRGSICRQSRKSALVFTPLGIVA